MDTEKVGRTPLGMTPVVEEEGHQEIEDIAPVFQGELAMRLKREAEWARERYQMGRNNELSLAEDINNYLLEEPPLTLDKTRWLLAMVRARLEEG